MTENELSDLELFTLIKCQNEEAFNFLFFRYEKKLGIVCYNMMKRFKSLNIDIDDLYQVGRIATNEAILNYEPSTSSFFSYWYSLVSRACITYVRTYLSKKNICSNTSSDILSFNDMEGDDWIFPDPTSLSDTVHYKMLFDNVKTYVEKEMDERDQKILQLLMEGYTFREIAEQLDVSYKVIDNRVYVLRKKIRKYMF